MPKFCCRHCGMITEDPTIVPCELCAKEESPSPMHYSITCPVCLGRTDFTRPEPFPTDIDEKGGLEAYLISLPSRVI